MRIFLLKQSAIICKCVKTNNSSLLKFHLTECEKENNFIEADITYKRINELKEIEKQQLFAEMKNEQYNQRQKLEEQIDKKREKLEEERNMIENKFKMIEVFNQHQKIDYENFQAGFTEIYSKHSIECKEEIKKLKKQIQECIKKKE